MHVHHNGDPAFLEKLVAKLEPVNGLALLLTFPKDLDSAKEFITKHPNRIMGLGRLVLMIPLPSNLSIDSMPRAFAGWGSSRPAQELRRPELLAHLRAGGKVPA